MTEMMKKPFLRAEDVAEILSISKPYAYKIIRELNEELKAKGYPVGHTVDHLHLVPPSQLSICRNSVTNSFAPCGLYIDFWSIYSYNMDTERR